MPIYQYGCVAQIAEASGLNPVQCGCKSCRSYQFNFIGSFNQTSVLALPAKQLVPRKWYGVQVPGTLFFSMNGCVVQSAEASGSKPGGCRFNSCHSYHFFTKAHVAQLAEAPDLESGGCGCKSCHGYLFLFPGSTCSSAPDFESG